MPDVVIAIDVGGTMIKSALVKLDEHIASPLTPGGAVAGRFTRQPTHPDRGPQAVVDHILDIAEQLADAARADGLNPVAAGLATPGIVDETRGVATYAANLGWHDVPLRGHAEKRLGMPAVLGHDVRAGGLAEATLGAGRDAEQLLFVPIGTGIAGAHVVAGQPFAGAHGAACELGHVVVRPQGRRCGCGRRGCLEAEASASAMATRYTEQTGEQAAAVEVAERAKQADPVAAQVWAETVDALADGLLTAITLYDPELVVVGGGLAEAGRQLLDPLTVAIDARRGFERMPRLVKAALGDRAGCLGAALLASAATCSPETRLRGREPS